MYPEFWFIFENYLSLDSIGTGKQLIPIPSVGFTLKYWRLWHVCLQNKRICSHAYNELEVANLQTAVDMCHSVYTLSTFSATNYEENLPN